MLGSTRRTEDSLRASSQTTKVEPGGQESKRTEKARNVTARQIMTTTVYTARIYTPLDEVVQLLASHPFGGVPVVDSERRVLGVLSESDLIDEHKREERIPRTLLYGVLPLPDDVIVAAARRGKVLKAWDLMTRPAITATEETTIHELADLMVQHWISRIPIVRGGRLVGIVTRADLIRALAQGLWP